MDQLAVLAYGAEQALPLTGTGTGSLYLKTGAEMFRLSVIV